MRFPGRPDLTSRQSTHQQAARGRLKAERNPAILIDQTLVEDLSTRGLDFQGEAWSKTAQRDLPQVFKLLEWLGVDQPIELETH